VANELTYSVSLFDAYPISMNQLDLDWSTDGHHKLTVTFAYTQWRNNSLQAIGMDLIETGLASVASAVGGLGGSAAGSLGGAIENITDQASQFDVKSLF